MDILQSIVLGIVEGITEFLPVSSTGHMIVASELMGIPQTETNKAFEVIIQLGAILAVVANYREKFSPKYVDLWVKVLIAFLPIAAVGFLFSKHIKALFSIEVVAIMFIIGGIAFLIVEYFLKNTEPLVKKIEDISYRDALIVGCAQLFGLIPGTSRSGSTIIGGLLLGWSRKVSAEFSFLLALPVMVAASSLDIIKHHQDFAGENFWPLAVGFVTAFISAFIVMKLFIAFLNRFTFNAFGIYRIIFGVALLYLLYIGVLKPIAV